MSTAFIYTVLKGDSLSAIAAAISSAAGASVAEIEAANPGLDPSQLSIAEVIKVPAQRGGADLDYTILKGDTLSDLSSALSQCAGLSYRQIESANPDINADAIQPGQQLNIPSLVADTSAEPPSTEVLQPEAETMGYWDWTWSGGRAPANASLSLAFSGWTDVATAVQSSAAIKKDLVGCRYLCFGGGNSSGAFDESALQEISAAIAEGVLKDYDGIAYDVEEGDSGLADSFAVSFAAAKKAGLKVLVTVSHSAPFGVSDAKTLMSAFFADDNIDYLSPQLYTTGMESENDYQTSGGVTWASYSQCKAAIVPSLVSDSYYPSAEEYFSEQGVTLKGYIQWSQVKS